MLQKHSAAAKNLVSDTERFKTGCFSNTLESNFGICHIATCSVPRTVDIFKQFAPIKTLEEFSLGISFFSIFRKRCKGRESLGKFSFGLRVATEKANLALF